MRRWMLTAIVSMCLVACGSDEKEGHAARDLPSAGGSSPTAAEIEALTMAIRPLLSRSTEGLRVTRKPSGEEAIELDGRFSDVALARLNSDGTVSIGCVDSEEAAADFMRAAPTAKEAK